VLPIAIFRAGRARARLQQASSLSMRWQQPGVVVRKSISPDGPVYHEKYYFTPGDTGFQGLADPLRKIGRGVSAGISGSLNVRAAWR